MKKTILTLIFFAFTISVNAQRVYQNDLRKATPEERSALINNLSPDQRKELIKQYRENILIEELEVPEEDKEEFSEIYNRYQQEQKQIKDEFNSDFDPEKLTDEEAKQKLEQSFVTGQKLLENRRKYAREMQNVLRPQQVLKMFQNEGRMRDKINRSSEMRTNSENTARPNPRLQNGSAGRQNSGSRSSGRR